jgi:hypothetical protein
MSVAERADALEVVNDWDDLDTPEQQPAEVRPQPQTYQPDPESETQERQPQQEQVDPATPVAEQQQAPTETPDQILQRVLAENADLQKKIANREWSDRGRVLSLEKQLAQRDERLQAIEASRLTDDQARQQQYDQAISQQLAAGNQEGAERLRLSLRAELAEKALQREREDKAIAQRHAQELQQAQTDHERTARGRQVQAAFIPTMQAEAMAAAQQYGLDESDTEDLIAFATPKSLRALAPNAPPEILGQMAMEQYQAIIERATALQQRRVQRNQQSFDTTRERAGGGSSRDLAKEFNEADDFDSALEAIDAGYVEPQSRYRGSRRR